MSELTGISAHEIKLIIKPSLFDKCSLRDISNAFNIENQIIKNPICILDGKEISLDKSIFKLLCVIKRLGVEKKEIIKYLCELRNTEKDLVKKYILPSIFLDYKTKPNNNRPYVTLYDGSNVSFNLILQRDGNVSFCNSYDYTRNPETNIEYIIKMMLEYIA